MSKRCQLQKEYYQQFGNYKGDGKYNDKYVRWLENEVLALRKTELRKTDVMHRFLEDVSKEKNIPIERLIVGVMQGDLYVWDYDSGRHYQDQFRVLSINGKIIGVRAKL